MNTIANAGLGLLLGGIHDQRQQRQQKRLQELQIAGQKEMGLFNQQLALDMWDKTNYEAQRRHMERAGLNVGLMYGSAGQGGTTQTPTGNVTGATAAGMTGEAGMAMQLGLQAEMQKANIENIKADTELKKTEAQKTAGIDTEKIKVEINNLLQTTDNAKMQNSIMQFDKTLKAIEANIAGLTQEEIVKQIQEATKKLTGEAVSANTKGEIDVATKDKIVKAAELTNQATAAGITQTKTQTEAIKTGIEQTKQTTKNLAQDEINKILANAMKASGVEPTDNAVVRILQRWLGENDISIESINRKMNRIGAWLKGEAGEQTWEKLTQIMRE